MYCSGHTSVGVLVIFRKFWVSELFVEIATRKVFGPVEVEVTVLAEFLKQRQRGAPAGTAVAVDLGVVKHVVGRHRARHWILYTHACILDPVFPVIPAHLQQRTGDGIL